MQHRISKELNLTPNPAFQESAEKGDGYVDRQSAPYICPVIGCEMNGKFKFSFIWGCGCVMSERALKEIKTKVCHKCQKPFTEEDVIILNALDEDLNLMQTRMEARQARLKLEKKMKKTAIKQEVVEDNMAVKAEETRNVTLKTEPLEKPTVSKLATKTQK
ncbi:LOW QUALITY PROTEIN: replication termination factor 2-like, partial [Homalodisca vitripennis]|uniref:LOW QUALITY PROTEIN: replication termination factor 2-like n=1 Tax=Homalodisca vitripennis TaxID=197043 RepID=UPI001EEC5344